LNRQFRKKDYPSDVLSFNYNDPEMPDEIYISAEKAESQAPEWDNTFPEEMMRLAVHGLLHLLGFDHQNEVERQIMREKEDYYLAP